MTGMSKEEQDRMLDEILAGERSETDDDVQQALQRSPELRERLEALRNVAIELDTVAEAELAEVYESLGGPDALGQDLAAHLDDAGVPRRRPRRLGPWLAAAAAAVVAAWLWFGSGFGEGDTNGDQPNIFLNNGNDGMYPATEYEFGKPFRWNFKRPPGGRTELKLYGADERERFSLVIEDDRQTWTPNESQRELFESKMRWSIRVLDAARELHQSGTKQFSLR